MARLTPPEPEPRYTLAEAQRILNDQKCGKYGHAFDILVDGGGSPTLITCPTCGRSWDIGEENG